MKFTIPSALLLSLVPSRAGLQRGIPGVPPAMPPSPPFTPPHGDAQLGEACLDYPSGQSVGMCAKNLRCVWPDVLAPTGVCEEPKAEGMECSGYHECADGLVCHYPRPNVAMDEAQPFIPEPDVEPFIPEPMMGECVAPVVVSEGQACDWEVRHCAKDLVCMDDGTFSHTSICLPPASQLGAGEVCDFWNRQCAEGFVCDMTCIERREHVVEGGACRAGIWDCEESLFCRFGEGRDGECVRGLDDQGLNEPCDMQRIQNCGSGLACDPVTRTCIEPVQAAEGEVCQMSFDLEPEGPPMFQRHVPPTPARACSSGLICGYPTNGSGNSVCLVPAGAGESCLALPCAEGLLCSWGSTPQDTVCVVPSTQAVGESCNPPTSVCEEGTLCQWPAPEFMSHMGSPTGFGEVVPPSLRPGGRHLLSQLGQARRLQNSGAMPFGPGLMPPPVMRQEGTCVAWTIAAPGEQCDFNTVFCDEQSLCQYPRVNPEELQRGLPFAPPAPGPATCVKQTVVGLGQECNHWDISCEGPFLFCASDNSGSGTCVDQRKQGHFAIAYAGESAYGGAVPMIPPMASAGGFGGFGGSVAVPTPPTGIPDGGFQSVGSEQPKWPLAPADECSLLKKKLKCNKASACVWSKGVCSTKPEGCGANLTGGQCGKADGCKWVKKKCIEASTSVSACAGFGTPKKCKRAGRALGCKWAKKKKQCT